MACGHFKYIYTLIFILISWLAWNCREAESLAIRARRNFKGPNSAPARKMMNLQSYQEVTMETKPNFVNRCILGVIMPGPEASLQITLIF